MTLDEAIKYAEEVAEEHNKAAKKWHENQVRKCELIPFAEMDYTYENVFKEAAAENRQLAEWLKELKRLREQTEPEKKPGKWMWNNHLGEYECSECGCNPIYEGITPDCSEIDKYRYCRWCGAPMEVQNE